MLLLCFYNRGERSVSQDNPSNYQMPGGTTSSLVGVAQDIIHDLMASGIWVLHLLFSESWSVLASRGCHIDAGRPLHIAFSIWNGVTTSPVSMGLRWVLPLSCLFDLVELCFAVLFIFVERARVEPRYVEWLDGNINIKGGSRVWD